ncbi:hypothetical protein GGS20DRAFT_316463 [Poronia punctata]|nr:hypothetical protein GGS20DRAFT_316463 [Poronia punctata]
MDQQDSEDMSFFDLDDWPVPGLSLTPVRPEKQTPQVCPQPEMPTIPETMAMNEQGSMPSHQYDLYKQQTPLVPGALLSTIALNEGNIDPEPESFDYMLDFSNIDEFDEGEGDVDVDGSIGDYQPSTMDTPSMDQRPLTSSSHSSAVGRLYPGIHAQMARERAESSQRLQFSPSRQVQQQLVSGPQGSVSSPQQPMYLLHSPASEAAVTQETISQLLVSQRAQGRTSESEEPATRIPPHKKTDREMDEDERRLRGEDGKRMTVKERRQLRNKVSARAFRNRRKGKIYYRVWNETTS